MGEARPRQPDRPWCYGITMHRRERLLTTSNPDARHDYLVRLSGDVLASDTPTNDAPAGIRIELRYVPDHLLLDPVGFSAYLAAFTPFASTLEALALSILDDISNEAVPRWAEVRAEQAAHRVIVEERQPDWDNPHLFTRMERY